MDECRNGPGGDAEDVLYREENPAWEGTKKCEPDLVHWPGLLGRQRGSCNLVSFLSVTHAVSLLFLPLEVSASTDRKEAMGKNAKALRASSTSTGQAELPALASSDSSPPFYGDDNTPFARTGNRGSGQPTPFCIRRLGNGRA